MKFPFHIIFFLFFVSCDKEEGFPKDFAGNWEFDLDSVYTEIENMELPEDETKALKYSFADIEKNQKCMVSIKGIFKYPQFISGVHVTLKVVSKNEDGYIFSETNSLSPAVTEYSLNIIKDGVWKSVLLDDDFKRLYPKLPNTYWKNKKGKAEQGSAPNP